MNYWINKKSVFYSIQCSNRDKIILSIVLTHFVPTAPNKGALKLAEIAEKTRVLMV